MDLNSIEKECHILEHKSSDDDTSEEVDDITRSSCCVRSTNFIRKNIKGASKVRRIEYDIDEVDNCSTTCSIDSKRPRRTSRISKKMAISNIENNLYKADMERCHRANLRRIESPKIAVIPESTECDNLPKKSYIKQTTCQACKEKWRRPLPTPKTPKIKKASVIPVENPLCRTNSRNRISMLIHKELYALESYNKRYSSPNSFTRSSKQKEEVPSGPTDYVKLDLLELARNKLEEREKETQKKLDVFLNGSQP